MHAPSDARLTRPEQDPDEESNEGGHQLQRSPVLVMPPAEPSEQASNPLGLDLDGEDDAGTARLAGRALGLSDIVRADGINQGASHQDLLPGL